MIFSQNDHKEKIPVTKSALTKIKELVDIMEGLEFRTVCVAENEEIQANMRRTVIDFIIAHYQTVHGAACSTIYGDSATMKEIEKKNLIYAGIAHGHGDIGGKFHSGTDDRAMEPIMRLCAGQNKKLVYVPVANPEIGKKLEINFPEFNLYLSCDFIIPEKVLQELKKRGYGLSINKLSKKISEIYSIVVNNNHELYAEINTEEHDILAGTKTPMKNEKVSVIEVPDGKYKPVLDRQELVKELVRKVIFPKGTSLPREFRRYEEIYRDIRRDKSVANFAKNITEYCLNNRNPDRVLIEEALMRIDERLAERIKFEFNKANPASHNYDLLSFFAVNEDCPDWFRIFMDKFNSAYADQKSKVVEKFSGHIAELFFDAPETFEGNVLDMIAKDSKQRLPTAADTLKQEQGYLALLEKLYVDNKKDEYIATMYGFAKLIALVSKEFYFEDLEKIKDAPIKKALIAMHKNEFDAIHTELSAKNHNLSALLAEKGYACNTRINIPKSEPKEIYAAVKSRITQKINEIIKTCKLMHMTRPEASICSKNNAKKSCEYLIKLKNEHERISSFEELIPDAGINKMHSIMNIEQRLREEYLENFLGVIEKNIMAYNELKEKESQQYWLKKRLNLIYGDIQEMNVMPKIAYKVRRENILNAYAVIIENSFKDIEQQIDLCITQKEQGAEGAYRDTLGKIKTSISLIDGVLNNTDETLRLDTIKKKYEALKNVQ